MLTKIKKLFLEHPNSVGESYFGHMACSAKFGLYFCVASFACIVHAIFPFACKTTGSSIAEKVVSTNKNRRNINES